MKQAQELRQAEIEKKIKIAEIERERVIQLRICETQTEISKVKAENPHAAPSHDNHHITRFSKLGPKFVESDLDAFFLQFEDLAAGMKCEKSDWAILKHTAVFGKAATVIAAMSQENKFDYDEVKSVILKAFESRPEAYRQKFRNYRKNEKQTFVEFVDKQTILFDKWVRSENVDSGCDNLRELVLKEQLN